MTGVYLVFDVESNGLHGEGFAVGWVAIHVDGKVLADGIAVAQAPPDLDKWVEGNVLPHLPTPTHFGGRQMRDEFWRVWMHWREQGAILAADVPWPVEARFLVACVDDDPKVRTWEGPYPLLDIASVRLAAGMNPLETGDRLPMEEPAHNPLADARQSARLLLEALAERQPW